MTESFFLVIEGLDGSGKTEISRRLKRALSQTHGKDVELTFEPHDPSAGGLYIRQVLTKRVKNVPPRTLALAFALNRADHNDRIITPFLEGGDRRIIISDRYYLSSLVYQSVPPLTMQDVLMLNAGARRPDLILFLNVSAKTSWERMKKRAERKELFEVEKTLDTMRDKYYRAIAFLQAHGDKVVEIDANHSLEVVLNSIFDALTQHGPSWLVIQRTLLESALDVFALDALSDAQDNFANLVNRLRAYAGADDLPGIVQQQVEALSYDEIGRLFIGYLMQAGYRFVRRMEWTELHAYEVEYDLPAGLTPRGTALLLSETRRYDTLTRKIQTMLDQTNDHADLRRVSDFMLVLDTTPLSLSAKYYEQDASLSKISPGVRVFSRKDMAEVVYQAISAPTSNLG